MPALVYLPMDAALSMLVIGGFLAFGLGILVGRISDKQERDYYKRMAAHWYKRYRETDDARRSEEEWWGQS